VIIFETVGEIDPRSFTVMGLSAKPATDNPIGMFGTGLKYAVAVLVRLGVEPVVWIGRDEYRFAKEPGTFRGKEYEKIVMKLKRRSWKNWRSYDLPFTTAYGLNWKIWQVLRELEANTRDERGRYYVAEGSPSGERGKTKIVVDYPDFDAAWNDRDAIFLPGALRARGTGHNYGHIEVFPKNGDGKAIYWRGLKVYEMAMPGLSTYNFLDGIELTEDRTAANEFAIRYLLGRWVVSCDDEGAIERIVTAEEDNWEHGVEFPDHMPPSAAFHRVMMRHGRRAGASSWGYYTRYSPRAEKGEYRLLEEHPAPWEVSGETLRDRRGRVVFVEPANYGAGWTLAAEAVARMINGTAKASAPVETTTIETDDLAAALPLRGETTNFGFLDETSFVPATPKQIVDDIKAGALATGVPEEIAEELHERLMSEAAIEPPEAAPTTVETNPPAFEKDEEIPF
jgi:hypothetical protein